MVFTGFTVFTGKCQRVVFHEEENTCNFEFLDKKPKKTDQTPTFQTKRLSSINNGTEQARTEIREGMEQSSKLT